MLFDIGKGASIAADIASGKGGGVIDGCRSADGASIVCQACSVGNIALCLLLQFLFVKILEPESSLGYSSLFELLELFVDDALDVGQEDLWRVQSKCLAFLVCP